MPSPNPIYKRGRRIGPPIEPLTKKLLRRAMKIEKLKSRKLWVTVLGSVLLTLGSELGLSTELIHSVVAVLSAYLIGQGVADINHRHNNPPVEKLIIFAAFLAFAFAPATLHAQDEALPVVDIGGKAPIINIDLPEVPGVPDPSWLDRGSIWTFAWYDVSDEGNGAGIRLGYDLSDALRIRLDYLVEGFDFETGEIADDAEATLSMRYDVFESESIFPYLIAGGGSAALSEFQWEYLIGLGIDYEFPNGIRAFAEFLHIRTESDGFEDRNEIRIGAGIPFSSLGKLNPFASVQPSR